jgi:polyisoprenyl-phosphate glycosyltransferase
VKNPQISIVIPVFNSSEIIAELYRKICGSFQYATFEIILVNDGSKDESWNTIRNLALQDSRVTGIDLRFNCGQDNAIMAGLRQATGAFVAIMDDDLQHDPADIRQMYEKCREGFDVVYGVFSHKEQSAFHRAGSRINAGFARWLIRKPKGLYLSPFKIITRELAIEISGFSGPFPYIDGILLSLTNRIAQVNVKHYPRYSGVSNYNLRRSAGVWFKLFTGFSVAPLRVAAMAGGIIALAGIGLMAYYLYEYFFTSRSIEGWTSIMLLVIFFGGVNLMVLGLIGEYIGRIYLTLNRKPQYSIRSIVSSGEEN